MHLGGRRKMIDVEPMDEGVQPLTVETDWTYTPAEPAREPDHDEDEDLVVAH